jgi:hypothetical protein
VPVFVLAKLQAFTACFEHLADSIVQAQQLTVLQRYSLLAVGGECD